MRRRRRVRAWIVSTTLLALLVLAALFALGAGSWWDAHHAPELPRGGAIVFIPNGASFKVASDQLAAAGVVRSALNFRLWARLSGADRQMRSGDYSFSRAMNHAEIFDVLRSGESGLHPVVVPEGSTLRDVAGAFAAAGFGGIDQFLCVTEDPGFLLRHDLPASGLEGYLYPDTYRFSWDESPVQILSAMLARYREEARRLETQRRASRLSEHEMVTLASIIEKETGLSKERSLVSAVFRNRLRLGMKLQADPTTVYGRNRVAPTAADLEADSPYNTYTRSGLPPGPICNPGRASLEAAVSPAAVEYLFFVARGDGTHVFSHTLEEHTAHVNELRRRQTLSP